MQDFLGTHPCCQGLGIGGEVLEKGAGHEAARDGGPFPIVLSTYSRRARALYERRGFRVVGSMFAGGDVWWLVRGAASVDAGAVAKLFERHRVPQKN